MSTSAAFAQSKTIETLSAKLGDKSIYIATPKAKAGDVNEYSVKVKITDVTNADNKIRDRAYTAAVRAMTKKVLAEASVEDISAMVAPESYYQFEIRSGRKDLNKTIQDYILASIVETEREQVKALFDLIEKKNELGNEILGLDIYQAAVWGDGSAELLGYEGTVVYLTDWYTKTSYIVSIYWSYCHC